MTAAYSDRRIICARDADDVDALRPGLAALVLDAARPYARALYGGDDVAASVLAASMARKDSEISLDRTQILVEEAELRGCYIALSGAELRACRRAELLEALRHAGPGAALDLRLRLAALGALFPPVAEDEFYLSKLAVCPQARGRGLSRILLEHYLARGRQIGFHRFRLDVCCDNLAARRLYERAGFRVLDQRHSDVYDLTYVAMSIAPSAMRVTQPA